MGQLESFAFDKGVNRKKSRLFLEPGELYSCSGFGYAHDGVLEAREPKTQGIAIDIATTSRINAIHRYGDALYASSKALCYGTASAFVAAGITQPTFNYVYYRDVDGVAYSNIDLLHGSTRPRFVDYESFIFTVDGETRRAYYEGKDYKWGIDNPTSSPKVTATCGFATHYNCFVTYYVIFPNDKVVETGASPVFELVDSDTTETKTWTQIPICPYEGSNLMIYRRLYRAVSGVYYLVATIADNTTTTYSDTVTDAALQSATEFGNDGYTTPPDNIEDVCMYLQRIFCIVGSKIYWSEPYMPFSFVDTSDVTVTKDNEPLIGLMDWGDQLYFPSASRWYRLQGTDPDTWAIKRTFTDNGVVNRHTIKKTKWGILGLWYDGIYVFDGVVTRNLTEKKLGGEFFKDLHDLSVCYAEFDGTRYYFYYASTGHTVDSCLVIDFTHYPEYRIYQDDFIAHAHEFYREQGIHYFAKSGYDYANGGNETIASSLATGDKAFNAITKRKCLDYLYYDINTSNKNVTVNITADGTTVDSIVINTSSRQRNRSRNLKMAEGYRFGLELSCADSQSLEIYAPWILEATPVGE